MADGLSGKSALMGLKQARRAVRLREADPEKVNDIITKAMQQAIILQKSGDEKLAKMSEKELRQIRKDLLARQVDGGAETEVLVGKLSGLLDTISSGVDTMSNGNEKAVDKAFSSLKDNLPSADTITSAIMTANPILGYAFKMFGDLGRSMKQRKADLQESNRAQAEERARRLSMFDEEGNLVEEQKEAAEVTKEAMHDMVDSTGDNPVLPYLDRIEQELIKFNEAFGVQREVQEEIAENTEAQAPSAEEKYENKREENAGAQRVPMNEKEVDYLTGGFGGLMDLGSIAGLFSIFGGFFSKIATLGKMFLKGGVIFLAFKGIFDFVDGFLNAESLFDNFDGSLVDRFIGGYSNAMSNIVTFFTDAIDSVLGFFGLEDFQFNLEEGEFANKIFDTIKDGIKWLVDAKDAIINQLSAWWEKGGEIIDSGIETIKQIPENLMSGLDSLYNDVSTSISEIFDSITSGISETVDSALDFFGFGDDEEESIQRKRTIARNGSMITVDENGNPVNYNEDDYDVRNYYRAGDLESPSNRATANMEEMARTDYMDRGDNGGNSATVIAPNNVSTQVSNNNFSGSRTSENKDPTHRRAMFGSPSFFTP